MAVNRPIRWDSTLSGLKEMSDSDLELLSYHLRKAWAADLSATYTGAADRDGSATSTNGFGAIYRGASGSATDSNYEYLTALTDKRKNAVYTSKSNNAFDILEMMMIPLMVLQKQLLMHQNPSDRLFIMKNG